MIYRAIAIGVTIDGHGIQFFSQDATVIAAWAHATAAAHHAPVEIYQIRDVLIETVLPEDNEK